MQITLITILLVCASFFICFGYFVKDFLLKIAGATLLLIVALSLWTSGYDYVNSINESFSITEQINNVTNITEKGGYVIHENIYKKESNIFTHGLGMVLLSVSLYLYLICWDIWKDKQEKAKIRY